MGHDVVSSSSHRDERNPAPSGDPSQASQGFATSVIRVEPEVGLAVLYLRSAKTGDVTAQIPAEKVVQEYSRHVQPEQAQSTSATGGDAAAAQAAAVQSRDAVPAATNTPAVHDGGDAPSPAPAPRTTPSAAAGGSKAG